MRAYKSFDESGEEDLGDIPNSQIPGLLDESEASQTEKNPFSLTLCRSNEDFVTITPVGKSSYLVYSDRIAGRKGFLASLFMQKPIQKIVEGRAKAIQAAMDYIESSREEFEQKYG